MKRLCFCMSVLMLLVVPACQTKSVGVSGQKISVDGGAYTNVGPAELNAMLKRKDFLLVNVHIPFAGNVADTDLSIPYDEIGQNLSRLPADKNAKIVLYCRSGRMSAIAAETLVKLGYTNIWNLQGGMDAWEQAGFPIRGK